MNVCTLEPYALSALSRLKSSGLVVTELEQADILLIRSQTRVDKNFLDANPDLKLIITATSGFDHIDWRETAKRNITVTHTPEANAQSTAELTIGLMIAAERQLISAHKNVKTGKWREDLTRSQGLQGKLLGIVGLGRVGRKVAAVAGALQMNVQAYDPYCDDFKGAERTGLIELLRTSDIVSLHVPLTRETKHLMNQPTFLEMQSDALLINTCRGPVVDENDLMVALDESVIAGAAMDVIEREPPPKGHRLLTHPKLLMTPHIGAFTSSAWEKASHEAVDKAIAFANGAQILDTLPLNTPWFDKSP